MWRPFLYLTMQHDPITTATPERLEKLGTVIERRQPTLTIVLENVHDAHNVAAVLRSCDAVGVLQIHCVYYGRNVYPEYGLKTSGTARKWVDQAHYETIDECYSRLRSDGFKIFTTALSHDAVSIYDTNLCESVALVFGNEHSGVSEEASQKADGNIIIPQVGLVQSLNISVACAVSLFEAYRQRMRAGMYNQPQMNEGARTELLRNWLMR